jgi:guanosine-3',5'-bis(diphosphate) 3'-pyrophosphohydrolase
MTYEEALKIVGKAFEGLKDKGGEDYERHLWRVARNVPKRLMVPAVLHDLLEDCPEWNPEKLLAAGLSKEDLDLVLLLTRHKGLTYDGYINSISTNKDAVIIKLADLRDNMNITRLQEITDKDIERLKKYHKSYKFLVGKLFNNN